MFDEGQTNTVDEPKAEQPSAAPVQEDWLVIGDRKYDKNAAVTKITHADTHISKLEDELADLRSKLELREAQEEAKKAMSTQTQSSPAPVVQNTTETGKEDGTELLSQVELILQKREAEAAKKSNLLLATEAARAVYGETYQQKLEETGRNLGLSKADIVELASTKPQAFKQLFGLALNNPTLKPSATSTVTVQSSSTSDDPYKTTAKLVLNSASAKERTSAIAALLAQANKR